MTTQERWEMIALRVAGLALLTMVLALATYPHAAQVILGWNPAMPLAFIGLAWCVGVGLIVAVGAMVHYRYRPMRFLMRFLDTPYFVGIAAVVAVGSFYLSVVFFQDALRGGDPNMAVASALHFAGGLLALGFVAWKVASKVSQIWD